MLETVLHSGTNGKLHNCIQGCTGKHSYPVKLWDSAYTVKAESLAFILLGSSLAVIVSAKVT